jgi:hypothetical protein
MPRQCAAGSAWPRHRRARTDTTASKFVDMRWLGGKPRTRSPCWRSRAPSADCSPRRIARRGDRHRPLPNSRRSRQARVHTPPLNGERGSMQGRCRGAGSGPVPEVQQYAQGIAVAATSRAGETGHCRADPVSVRSSASPDAVHGPVAGHAYSADDCCGGASARLLCRQETARAVVFRRRLKARRLGDETQALCAGQPPR